jgi:hypothetical protein
MTTVTTTQSVSAKLFINRFIGLNWKTKEKMDVELSITTYKIDNGKEKNEIVLSAAHNKWSKIISKKDAAFYINKYEMK